MRRLLASFVAAAVVVSLSAWAAEKAPASPPQKAAASRPLHEAGQVSKWDAVSKSFSMKVGKHGKHEVQFTFTDKTKFEGVPAVGEAVDVQYVKEGLNTFVAQKITVRPAKAAGK